jgi:uncharacterized protein
MKILIDIGHPAHFHYFRNFIRIMREKGHEFIITARDKDITHVLLQKYNINYINRGKGENGSLGKLVYLIKGTFIIYRIARRNKIDFFLSFASPYASFASFLLKKPGIVLDDTEHNRFNHIIYKTFSNNSLHPIDFKKKFGNKQLFFDGTMENAYLFDKEFKIESQDYIVKKILIRFVSWNATHDKNQSGFTNPEKEELVTKLLEKGDVYISSESPLPINLEKYKLKLEPHLFHDFLLDLDLYVGESGSIATEAAFLGIPSIVFNSASNNFGVFSRFQNLGLLYIAKDGRDAIETAEKFISQNSKDKLIKIASDYRKSIIDLNALLVWFVENYPESREIMKENPDYQYNFK